MPLLYRALILGALGTLGVYAAQGSASACLQFTLDDLLGVAVAAQTYYPANAEVVIASNYSSLNTSSLPAFCRLQLLITTNETAGSFANTELWLPDDWNDRLITIGNGGLAGGADVLGLGTQALPQHFAALSTNAGHNSTAIDCSWAGPHNDNAIVDWGWRATHLSVIAGKEVVKQYYGQAAKRSYYHGCSNGGRQGLKEVQLFPDSFDGVVIGSPANWVTRQMPWGVRMSLNVLPTDSSRFIPQDVWSNVIWPEVMKQCDALDGVSDSVINNPSLCNFRPETLTCRPSQNTSTCLNEDQIEALHRIYADYYETNQTYVFGGFNPGGEDAYFPAYFGGPSPLSTEWLKYAVLNDTEWTIDQYNSTLFLLADELDVGQANAIDPDLTAFGGPSHNGKLLHYVGLTDEPISPRNSMYYYETVHAYTRAHSTLEIDDFYRLFTAPGMGHCTGGHGANVFGGVVQPAPVSYDPENSVIAAMVRWVEEGIAPETIIATKFKDNKPDNGVEFTRPLCKYPLNLRYRGGDPNSASSFDCA